MFLMLAMRAPGNCSEYNQKGEEKYFQPQGADGHGLSEKKSSRCCTAVFANPGEGVALDFASKIFQMEW